jgi:hypothetical protein
MADSCYHFGITDKTGSGTLEMETSETNWNWVENVFPKIVFM